MDAIKIILLNFSETRRRSLKLWRGIPKEHLNWKPDDNALTIIEMIRHVLEAEHLFHKIIENRGNLGNYKSPWKNLPYQGLEHEIDFSKTYRTKFINMIKAIEESDLEKIKIERSEVNQSKVLGDYLNRIAYHESVHTGQLLDYLRTIGTERPSIWD
ncbi:DinB family protein [Jejuia spongiicola]|uniref:DinB family protein n=1 Tax=Jejuia spongiicola TaxID=2942207 RepID=A0ABT0QFY5_9FLAO|nr:DinB family protein [Jejuia spongiicola]MCL6295907.1 DinB family protein [Jejuia spongiicola]